MKQNHDFDTYRYKEGREEEHSGAITKQAMEFDTNLHKTNSNMPIQFRDQRLFELIARLSLKCQATGLPAPEEDLCEIVRHLKQKRFGFLAIREDQFGRLCVAATVFDNERQKGFNVLLSDINPVCA